MTTRRVTVPKIQKDLNIIKSEIGVLKRPRAISRVRGTRRNVENLVGRRRNRVRGVRNANMQVSKMRTRTIAGYLGLNDAPTEQGFEHLTQSLFSGVAGIHRGVALGAQTTALCRFKQVFDISIVAGNQLTYAWAPTALSSANTFVYCSAAGTKNDPYNSQGGGATVGIAGPFNTTLPATEWRVVRAAATITPTTAVLGNGGVQHHCYTPAVYVGAPTVSTLRALPSGSSWTSANNFENFEIFKAFSGLESVKLQWFPDDDEVDTEAAEYYSSNTTTPFSGFVGYIIPASGNAASYHIELDYGIEYTPTTAYRPFVDRGLPKTHPSSFYFLNQLIGSSWDKLVIQTVKQYDLMTAQIDHLPSGWATRYQLANEMAPPADGLPLIKRERLMTKIEDEGFDVCGKMERLTGMDMCGTLQSAAYNVGAGLGKASMGLMGPSNGYMMIQ